MNNQLQIAITTSSFGKVGRRPLDLLEERGVQYQLNPHGRKLQPAETVSLLQNAAGVVAGTERYDRDVLSQLPHLKIISRCGTGMDSIDLAAAAELGVQVVNTPDAHVDAVAELTLAGLLDLLRHVTVSDSRIRRGAWQKPFGRLLRGKAVGIVGLGRVGKALVKLLRPFDATIWAYDPYPDADFAAEYQVTYAPLDELLPQVDVVSLHTPYSAENRHLLNGERLALMRPGSFLLNASRGGLVDEEALYASLQSGHLGGAYLDVFEREPYDGPLTQLENVVLSPHIGSYAVESRLRMETEAVENLLAALMDDGR
jgi:D-3-phosphoglycerate dehydrogenase / 2-oxoglutarate reductase